MRYVLCQVLLLAASAPTPRVHADLPIVQANDNRTAAGRLKDGVLTVRLVAVRARWYPEAGDGASAEVVAFAEEGKAPQIPGPLLRVPEGTTIDMTITNTLSDSTLWLHWLATKPSSAGDSVAVLPGESRQLRFGAGAAGTYLYRGTISKDLRAGFREEEQQVGAFIVDAIGARTNDRIFVINIWREPEDTARKLPVRRVLAINGRSWPYTESLAAATGDTLNWRVINGSRRAHPMHLHGFYYTINARGSAYRDTVFTSDQRRLAVTEELPPFSTMAMTWVPERPGNWLFHCHLSFHVVGEARLVPHVSHTSDPRLHMAGLVLGIAIAPAKSYREPARSNVRKVKMFVNEGKPRRLAARALGLVEQRDERVPAPDSLETGGNILVLTRGQPTDIAVTNRLREPTAIHWHGIELESFSDGVAGYSGSNNNLAPAIEPSKTFNARLTLPRAGTFIYHTHLNDIEQITSGLHGAIIVLPTGEQFNSDIDHVYIASWDGQGTNPRRFVVNGDSVAPRRTYRANKTHRFRFINIGPATPLIYELNRDSMLVKWRAHAKDGADLPPAQAVITDAARRLDVGETFDALFEAERGEYMLVVRLQGPRAATIFRQRLVFD